MWGRGGGGGRERTFRNLTYSITGLCVVGTCLACLCVCLCCVSYSVHVHMHARDTCLLDTCLLHTHACTQRLHPRILMPLLTSIYAKHTHVHQTHINTHTHRTMGIWYLATRQITRRYKHRPIGLGGESEETGMCRDSGGLGSDIVTPRGCTGRRKGTQSHTHEHTWDFITAESRTNKTYVQTRCVNTHYRCE